MARAAAAAAACPQAVQGQEGWQEESVSASVELVLGWHFRQRERCRGRRLMRCLIAFPSGSATVCSLQGGPLQQEGLVRAGAGLRCRAAGNQSCWAARDHLAVAGGWLQRSLAGAGDSAAASQQQSGSLPAATYNPTPQSRTPAGRGSHAAWQRLRQGASRQQPAPGAAPARQPAESFRCFPRRYDIKAPSMFNVRNVGKTLVTRTQGTKVRRAAPQPALQPGRHQQGSGGSGLQHAAEAQSDRRRTAVG
jgi:hypothetical protein